jgi:uncharacterized membrane protein
MASAPTPTPPASSGMQQNVAGALCYIWIIGVIFLFIEPYNKNRFIRFHAFQSIFYGLAWFALVIVWMVLGGILAAITHGCGGCIALLAWPIIFLGYFVILVIMAVKAYGNQEWKLPVIGDLAAKQAGK